MTAPALQAEVIAFLEQRAFDPPPERIDTHAAIVFLSGDRAFKLKRAVRYSFLDFSTLEQRHAALAHELELNRRTAPQLYLGLVPVVRSTGGELALGGEGEVVEWLLEMRRFPQEARLDRVAEAGGLTPPLVEALASEIVRFHRAAAVRPEMGGAAAMRAVIEGNAEDLRALAPAPMDSAPVEQLIAATAAACAAIERLLETRRRAWRVRHCHGDLHLENIVLLDGRPVLFDCIEFDDALACIDVLYDLAFLVMDLIGRGYGEAAHRLLQAYNDAVIEDAGLATLPFFLSVRAAIRAKVEGFAGRVEADPARRDRHQRRARDYLALARRLLAPVPPQLIAIGGRSGTGKSSLARALAPAIGAAPGATILRSDVIRKRLFGRRPDERLPPTAYRAEISARVFGIIERRAADLLAAGRSVICDAVYGEPWQRQRIEAVAERAGVPFAGFWLDAPAAVLEARVAARRGDASDADVAVVRRQLETVDDRAVGWRRIDASRPLDAMLRAVQAALAG